MLALCVVMVEVIRESCEAPVTTCEILAALLVLEVLVDIVSPLEDKIIVAVWLDEYSTINSPPGSLVM